MSLYGLYIGPSGLGVKTVVLKDYCIPIMLKIGELTGRDMIFPSGFSTEGIVQYISKIRNTGLILKDELTILIKDTTHKGYASDQCEVLSQMYDSFLQKRYTRKTQLDEGQRCYVNMLATTTPYLYKILDETFFIQGLGNRFIYIITSGSNNTRKLDPKTYYEDFEKAQKSDMDINKFAERLSQLIKHDYPINFFIMDDAAKQSIEFQEKVEEVSRKILEKDKFDLRSSYYFRLPFLLKKLMCIYSTSRQLDSKGYFERSVGVITPEDVEWAQKQCLKYYKYFNILLDDWADVGMTKEVHVEVGKGTVDYIVRMLNGFGGKATSTQIYRKTNWSDNQLRTYMTTANKANAIEIIEEKPTGPGRPTVWYKVKEVK